MVFSRTRASSCTPASTLLSPTVSSTSRWQRGSNRLPPSRSWQTQAFVSVACASFSTVTRSRGTEGGTSWCSKTRTARSRGLSLVEGEHTAEPFQSVDATDGRGRMAGGEGDDVVQALVVALGMVMVHELAHDGAQMTLAERNDVAEALVLDRANEPLGVGVEVRAFRRQAQQLHARGSQEVPEVRRVERITIDDQVPEARQRARRGVGEVAGDLRHPSAVGRAGNAGDVNAPGLEVDDEQHEVAYEAPAREHLRAEEVRRGDGAPMRLEKGLPGHRPSSARSGLDAVLG